VPRLSIVEFVVEHISRRIEWTVLCGFNILT
jgi:hypothetical protein